MNMHLRLSILGDPHLGRTFRKGVPAHRLGEREALVRADFYRQLDPGKNPVHVCMGDLFNDPKVSYETLAFAIAAYTDMALTHPETQFFILQGNHDKSRDAGVVAAWDIFVRCMIGISNVTPVTAPMTHERYGFLPWHPTLSAAELLAELGDCRARGIDVLFGHWDTDPRTQSHNLIPTEAMAEEGILVAYTGHVHRPATFLRDGVSVIQVGSMQPYAQGEDGGQSPEVRYVTVDLHWLTMAMEQNTPDLSQVCLRLQLQPGEQPPDVIPDCRSFDVQRLRPVEAAASEPVEDISTEGFDVGLAYETAMRDRAIIPEVKQQIDTRWQATSTSED